MGKSVIRAIKAVEQQPELLVQAFRYRLYADIESIENLESLGIKIEPDLVQSVKTLAKTTRLSEQEVTRLCLEAYVYNL